MARINTDRIWTVNSAPLVPREGRINLDRAHVFINDSDSLGPIHVESGLQDSDIAVFLGIRPNKREQELTERSVGYLVTQVDEPPLTSGIIVSGELIEGHPQSWLTDRLIGAWVFLMAEGYSPRDFGLNGLHDYLYRKHLPNHSE